MNIEWMKTKAAQSPCRHRISAFGFSRKGEFVGSTVNRPRFPKHQGGLHAEALLIKRYGKILKTILICRVNKSGNLLPIDPCSNCKELADKYGIRIISISESFV